MNQIYKYNYNAINKLPFLTEDFHGNIKKICIFDIFQSNFSPPFLRFLLDKDANGELDFLIPTKDYESFLKYFFENYNVSFSSEIMENARLFSLDKNHSNFYLFIDITNLKLVTSNKSIQMVLIDEIMNKKQMFNLKIAKTVSEFFTRNYDFVFLQNESNIDYEIPIVCYVSKPYSKLEYTFVFGNQKNIDLKNKKNYYLFTDFEKATEDSNLFSSEEKKGLIRFALFLGKTLVLEKESELLNIEEKMYNSIQINDFPSSIYLIENSDQQIPLSYQIING